MVVTSRTPCPFCNEANLPSARICGNCGEWLARQSYLVDSKVVAREVAEARAAAEELKRQQFRDGFFIVGSVVSLVVGVGVGLLVADVLAGIGVFVLIVFLLNLWRQR